MEGINYPIVIAIFIAAIILIVWLIRRNRKDEMKHEKDVIKSEPSTEDLNRNEPVA